MARLGSTFVLTDLVRLEDILAQRQGLVVTPHVRVSKRRQAAHTHAHTHAQMASLSVTHMPRFQEKKKLLLKGEQFK